MGNVAVTVKRRSFAQNKKRVYVDITGSTSYATNGDTLQAADIDLILDQKSGAEDLSKVDLFVAELGSAGHEVYLDRTAKKLKFFNGTTEIAGGINLSAVVCRCMFEFGDSPAVGV